MALLSLPHVDDVTEVFTLLSDIYDTLHVCVCFPLELHTSLVLY